MQISNNKYQSNNIKTIANYIKAGPGGFICSKMPFCISQGPFLSLFLSCFLSFEKMKKRPYSHLWPAHVYNVPNRPEQKSFTAVWTHENLGREQWGGPPFRRCCSRATFFLNFFQNFFSKFFYFFLPQPPNLIPNIYLSPNFPFFLILFRFEPFSSLF